jgi:phytoene synthase
MSAKPSELDWHPDFDPFSPTFLPDQRAKGKSHFQSAFRWITSAERRQALNDFYAFCRLVDDLADERGFGFSSEMRHAALDRIQLWLHKDFETDHPYWSRFQKEIERFHIPLKALIGVIEGCRYDIHEETPLTLETWEDLDAYAYGVAGCVGMGTMAILGESSERAHRYAVYLGLSMQYLNIMRDLEEDWLKKRIYVPLVFLRTLPGSEEVINFQAPWNRRQMNIARRELYLRAKNYRKLACPFAWSCLPAEMMASIYWSAAQKYWRKGHTTRLSGGQKLRAALKAALWFRVKSPKAA